MWSFPVVDGLPPCGRGGHTCTSVGSRIILFGGADRVPTAFNDVWTLDTAEGRFEWTRISTSYAPGCTLLPRAAASVTAVGDQLYLFGGQEPSTGECYNDVKVLDLNSWQWSNVQVVGGSPPPRHSHAAGLLANTVLLIYGGAGQPSHALSDVWLFNTLTLTWECLTVSGRSPPGREMHSACMVDSTRMMIYGGRSADGKVLCDAAVFDASKLQWTKVEPTPFARCAHSCVLLAGDTPSSSQQQEAPMEVEGGVSSSNSSGGGGGGTGGGGGDSGGSRRGAALLYGGFSGDSIEGDVLSIDPDSLEIELVRRGPRSADKAGTVPFVRFAHCAATVTNAIGQQVMVVIGGVNTAEDMNDVAVWTPAASVSHDTDTSSPPHPSDGVTLALLH